MQIGLSVLGCILIIMIAVGYYYNRKTGSIKNSKGEKISATALYKIFALDSTAKNYIGKIVEVSGEVSEVFKNQQNQNVIQLKSGKEGAFINCTMEEGYFKIAKGNQVSIKGICNGIGETDTILGIFGDVYLTRCYSTNSGK